MMDLETLDEYSVGPSNVCVQLQHTQSIKSSAATFKTLRLAQTKFLHPFDKYFERLRWLVRQSNSYNKSQNLFGLWIVRNNMNFCLPPSEEVPLSINTRIKIR